ncbi:zf-HC2 domain-containing protein [Methylobacterium organophilum]|uniref:anti-sigma factor family protein n=1 Tax=Methylobacterium organophilum TaxID=410 RepID=UPI001F147F9C|nr:zf-HC2 domain-containing protein [Methylobacterium organophilum]UMY18913.1 zf-HC2 domain-containing protein [Methylobacterium organophilum]
MVDPVTETDLIAYVDGELDAMRRLEVEAHLACHPQDAAKVMADLRDRDALREAFTPTVGLSPDRLRSGARRMDRALAWQRVSARLRRAAAIAVLVGAGWLAHSEIGTFGVPDTFASPVDPVLVEEAQQAREAAAVRARSQALRPGVYDRADLQAATGLDLPELPADWTVQDVQVFPGRHGTGVEVSIHAGQLGDLALFAMPSGRDAAPSDGVARPGDGATAYWRSGRTSYALSGALGDGLGQAAGKLAMTAVHPAGH